MNRIRKDHVMDPAYVKLDGINGESQDRGHEDRIDLLSFGQGQYIPSSSVEPGSTSMRAVFEQVML